MTFIKVCVLLNMFAFLVVTARAQEQSSPRERALMERVSAEINGNLVCSTNVAALQDKIKDLEQKLKDATK